MRAGSIVAYTLFLLFCVVAAAPASDRVTRSQDAKSEGLHGVYPVAHTTIIFRRPSISSQRMFIARRGSKVIVEKDLGPWLVVRSLNGRPRGYVRRTAIATAFATRERMRLGAAHGLPVALPEGPDVPRLAPPKIDIVNPKNGARIEHKDRTVLVTGRVSHGSASEAALDLFFVIDVSGSTRKYAGLNFLSDLLPSEQLSSGIFDSGHWTETDNSILGAEIGATRRLLSQLNPRSTRVGIVTFGPKATLVEPLSGNYRWLHEQLKEVLRRGSHGGTHMAEGLRLGIRELAGIGLSRPRPHARKVQVLLTDGYPTLPTGLGREPTPEDIRVTVSSARLARKADIKVHVFALGENASARPQAAVDVARATGGKFTPVETPADILSLLDQTSMVDVAYVNVHNETTGEASTHVELSPDGYFQASVPVRSGLNRVRVASRSSDGSTGAAEVKFYFLPRAKRSLELDVFLEKKGSAEAKKDLR